MNDWFGNIKAPKYLRYLFFIAYSFYRRFISERGDAHFKAISLIALGKVGLISILFNNLTLIPKRVSSWISLVFLGLIFYVFFWHKKKWKMYLNEFSNLKNKQIKRGYIYLFIGLYLGTVSYEINSFLRVLFKG